MPRPHHIPKDAYRDNLYFAMCLLWSWLSFDSSSNLSTPTGDGVLLQGLGSVVVLLPLVFLVDVTQRPLLARPDMASSEKKCCNWSHHYVGRAVQPRSRAAAAAVVAVRVVAGASAADAYNGCEVVEVDEPAAPWSVDVTSIHCFQQSKQYCPSDNVDQQGKISVNSDGGTPSSLLSEFNRKIKAWKPK
ncbi:hypothetical protein BHE74_00006617 [Ensete ventricosum]|nr:hypothetical protein BHE74_00006617 [Ensete ventricosum]